MGSSIIVSTQPPKGTSLRGKTSYYLWFVKLCPLVRPVRVIPKKKERQRMFWQTGYFSKPPTTSDQCGSWSLVLVLTFKFHQNWLSGYRDMGGQNLAYCITLVNGLYNSLYYRTEVIHMCLNTAKHHKTTSVRDVNAIIVSPALQKNLSLTL